MTLGAYDYTDFGYIEYDTSFPPTYTAYDDPVDPGRSDWGTIYAKEANSPVIEQRAYYSFHTSAIPTAAVITNVDFIYNHYATNFALPGPGEGIQFNINYSIGWAFIGGTITVGDWGGGTMNNNYTLATYPSTPPTGTTITKAINITHVNKTGDTDFEIKETSAFSGGYSGSVQYEIRSHSTRGAKYPSLRVTYFYLGVKHVMLLGAGVQ